MKSIRDGMRFEFECSEDWDAMPGDSKGRHCASCNKRVHDLAAMTDAEIHNALSRAGGRICARMAGLAMAAVVTMIEPAAAQQKTAPSTCELPAEGMRVIEGSVADHAGAVLPAAELVVRRDGGEIRCVTGADGKFRIGVAPGIYSVTIASTGFKPYQNREIDVRAQSVRIDAKLDIGPITMGIFIVDSRKPRR